MQGRSIRTGSGSDLVLAIENFIGETRSYAELNPVATAPGSDAAGSPPLFVNPLRAAVSFHATSQTNSLRYTNDGGGGGRLGSPAPSLRPNTCS